MTDRVGMTLSVIAGPIGNPIKSGRFLRRDRPLANIYVNNQKVQSISVCFSVDICFYNAVYISFIVLRCHMKEAFIYADLIRRSP